MSSRRNQTTRTCAQSKRERTNKVSAEVECADDNGAVSVDFELKAVDEVHKRHIPQGFPPGATHLRKQDDACGRPLSDMTPSTM